MPVDEARAVITYQSAGAVSDSNITSISPAYPASVATGDLLILIIGMKPSAANSGSVTAPEGWTLITSLVGAGGYGGTLGGDTGNTNVFAYYKVAEGNETGSLRVRLTIINSAWAQMYRLTNATQDWSVAGTTGSDTTAGNVSITMSADPGVTAGDFILGAMVIPTDVTTPAQFSAEAFTQTGVTFGAVAEISEPDSTTGNDIGGFVVRSSATAGTGSAAPVMTATAGGTTTNVRGPGIFIRVRATGAITYQTQGALNYIGATLATSVCPAHPASVVAGDLLVTLIGMKPSAANSGSVTTPSGWTAVSGGSLTGAGGYGGTLGADTGNTNVFSFYRVATGTEATERCFALTTNGVSWAQMYRFSNTTQTWQLAGTTGSDTTAGNVSITMAADPGVTVDDHILGAMVIPTDISTPAQFSAEAFTQTGVTFGTVNEISEPDSTTGNDIGGFVVRSTATAGTGSAAPVMTATAGGTTTNVRGPGVFIRIRELFPAFTQAAFRFYEDGTESGSTAIAAQDTNISRDITGGSSNLQLRLRVQETNAVSGAATDDYQLQYSKNAGAYADVTGASTNVLGFNSASLTDGGATTNRLGAGSGSFLAGVTSEDGLADNHQITASNYTEYLFSLTLVFADLANSDTLDFQLLRNGATIAAYSVTPRITVTKVTPGSFNAVEVGTAVNGIITTKIAGTGFSLDVVAISGGVQQAAFTSPVTVELLGNVATGVSIDAQNCPTSFTLQQAVSPDPTVTAGRVTVPFAAVPNAWRDVRVRVRWPTSSPSVTWCSSDNFAIRPKQFVGIQVRDASRTTAGTTNTLNNTSSPGTGTVHNAGRPFRIDATAENGAGSPATTTQYSPDAGQPVAVLSQCGAGAVCPATPGTLTTTTGTWSASSGVITTTTASYNDVGAFDMVLEDRTFASVDSGDGTATSVRYIPSDAAVTVGRFVPDYFTLEAGSTITPRSDIGACSGSTFTYMGEPMTLVFTLKARDSSNNVTPNYTGATLGALVLNSSGSYSFGAIDSITPTPLTSRLDTSLIAAGATGSWSAGSASITAPLALSRDTSPDGPYTSLKIGMAPSDPDSVTLQATALNLDADNNTIVERAQVGPAVVVRFGRLRLSNAFGSENSNLAMPAQAQYWSGNSWILNSADSCTSLPANAFFLIGATAGIAASAVTITGGTGTLTLTKPTTPAVVSVDVAANLGASGNDQSCLGSHGGTAANRSWLRSQNGNCATTYDRDPSARATFGLNRSAESRKTVHVRERF